MKKSKKINSPKKLLQQQYKRVLIILIILFVLVSLPLLFMGWAMGTFNFSYYKAEQNNPAKKLAEIMIPFEKEHNLEKIQEDNDPVFFSNSVASFSYKYLGNQSVEEMKNLIKKHLAQNGYTLEEKLEEDKCNDSACDYNEWEPTNNGYSYWVLSGKNRTEDEVFVGIYDHETDVPSGKISLSIDFTSQR